MLEGVGEQHLTALYAGENAVERHALFLVSECASTKEGIQLKNVDVR